MPTIDQKRAAELAGVTARRMRQLDHEKPRPPRTESGHYDLVRFKSWLRLRALGKANPMRAQAFDDGQMQGADDGILEKVEELREVLGIPPRDIPGCIPGSRYIDPDRRDRIAELHAKVAAAQTAAQVVAVIAEFADWAERESTVASDLA